MRLGIDIETYSSIDLKDAGVYHYVEAPDFSILMIGYTTNDGETVEQIDLTKEGYESLPEYQTFLNLLYDPGVQKTAFNANFERTCLTKWLSRPMPPEEWQCTMVLALELGLPGSLAAAGVALGLPEDKQKDKQGKSLIQYFSRPVKPTKANGGRTRNLPEHAPDKWDLYLSYNRQDVVAEQEILRKVEVFGISESERSLWALDQQMNDNGIRIDRNLAAGIVEYDETRRAELTEEAAEITGLRNPNSLAQLKVWIASKRYPMESITKDTVADALADPRLPEDVRRVLEIRSALGKTSVKKYSAMLSAICDDDRLRGVLQFYGANRTGRWAGRLVQVHNLARNNLPDLDLARELAASGRFEELETLFGESAFVFSELIRTAFIPSEGCRFVVSDFSAIEARVLSWVAGESWRLKTFEEGGDIYCATASQMYHVPVVKHGVNGELRQKGKVAELACGYGGGVGAMKRMDRSGAIPEEELQGVVDAWRNANPTVPRLWRTFENAAKKAIRTELPVSTGARGIAFMHRGNHLFVKLPSGRRICYQQARLKETAPGREEIVYMGVNQETKQWGETSTYGGKLTENIIQAIARDCLAVSMQRVTDLGYKIVMHVHDEMIVDVPIEDMNALDVINRCMSEPIEWAPGLPLKGDGYETAFYKKD